MSPFQRHLAICNNAVLPGGRTPFLLGAAPVGWLGPEMADFLEGVDGIARVPEGLSLADAARLPAIARAAADAGLCRWRGEAFDVRADLAGPVLATIDRGALAAFGVQAQGVHMDGIVRRADGLHLWVARRSASKAVDPGKLDHITAGGMPAGLTAMQTLVKEAGEEAAIPPELAARAVQTCAIRYAMDRPEGLSRDTAFCYELELPADFVPVPADGEVAGFELWPIARAVAVVRETEDFKFNVSLVLMTLFQRHGLLPDSEAAEVAAWLHGQPC
jgi:8-oxo-dGTP pyrophosphatase MutT (NUDIX family)